MGSNPRPLRARDAELLGDCVAGIPAVRRREFAAVMWLVSSRVSQPAFEDLIAQLGERRDRMGPPPHRDKADLDAWYGEVTR